MTARLPGGDGGLINYSRTTSITDQRDFVYIRGPTGHLNFVPSRNEPVIETEGQLKRVDLPEAKKGLPGTLTEFPACVREDLELAMSGEEGLRDLAIVLAAYRSAYEGREISVSLS